MNSANNGRRVTAVVTLVISAMLLVTPSQAELSAADIAPDSLVAGGNAAGNVSVTFTTEQAIATAGTIIITFPAGFDVSGVSMDSGGCDGVSGGGGLNEGSLAVAAVGQVVTITFTGGALEEQTMPAGAQSCVLSGIVNPTAAGATGAYNITTAEGSINPSADTIIAAPADQVSFTAAPATTDTSTGVQFTAELEDEYGNINSSDIDYAVDEGATNGTISSTGFFTPNNAGIATINASAASDPTVYARAIIVVSPGSPASISFTIAPTATNATTQQSFEAEALDSQDIANTTAVVLWSVDEGATNGSIDANGLFTPNKAGVTTINASIGAVYETAQIIVSAAAPESIVFTSSPASTDQGDNVTFMAEARDAKGNANETATSSIAWAVDEGAAKGSITSGGVYTPNNAGLATINATYGSTYNTSQITVTAVPDSIQFTSAPTATNADTNQTFTAVVKDKADAIMTGAAPTYNVDSGSGAIDDTTGEFMPDQTGTTVIEASYNAVTKTTSIVVSPGASTQIVFTSAPGTTTTSAAKTFVAEARDALGNENDSVDISYSIDSGNGSIGASTGIFTPSSAGTTVVNATGAGLHKTTSIVVSAVSSGGSSSGGGGGGSSGSSAPTSSTSSTAPKSEAESTGTSAYGVSTGTTKVSDKTPRPIHQLEPPEGAVGAIVVDLASAAPVTVVIRTYDTTPQNLPAGFAATPVFMDIEVETVAELEAALITLRPISTAIFPTGVDNLVVLHHHDGRWEAIETMVQENDDETVTISFRTDGFSEFAVAYSPSHETLDSEDVEFYSQPGLGGVLALIAIAAMAILLRRRTV